MVDPSANSTIEWILDSRLDEDDDAVEVASKEVHRLEPLQTLVHEGGGIDGDLGAHRPVGVLESVLYGNAGELFCRHAEERTAGAREPDGVDLVRTLALEALEDGIVLGVDGEHPPG